jgi:hypothetical protein
MSDPDRIDPLLAAHFEREHQHVPADAFVAATLHRIRFQQRLTTRIQTMLRIAVLLAAIIASPWLIAGATRLNAALAVSLNWIGGLPGAWVVAVLAAVLVLASRARSH